MNVFLDYEKTLFDIRILKRSKFGNFIDMKLHKVLVVEWLILDTNSFLCRSNEFEAQ